MSFGSHFGRRFSKWLPSITNTFVKGFEEKQRKQDKADELAKYSKTTKSIIDNYGTMPEDERIAKIATLPSDYQLQIRNFEKQQQTKADNERNAKTFNDVISGGVTGVKRATELSTLPTRQQYAAENYAQKLANEKKAKDDAEKLKKSNELSNKSFETLIANPGLPKAQKTRLLANLNKDHRGAYEHFYKSVTNKNAPDYHKNLTKAAETVGQNYELSQDYSRQLQKMGNVPVPSKPDAKTYSDEKYQTDYPTDLANYQQNVAKYKEYQRVKGLYNKYDEAYRKSLSAFNQITIQNSENPVAMSKILDASDKFDNPEAKARFLFNTMVKTGNVKDMKVLGQLIRANSGYYVDRLPEYKALMQKIVNEAK